MDLKKISSAFENDYDYYSITNEIIKNSVDKQRTAIKSRLILALSLLNFEFENDSDLIEFCKNRVYKICLTSEMQEIYFLDYKTTDNKGTFLFKTYYQMNNNFEKNKHSFEFIIE